MESNGLHQTYPSTYQDHQLVCLGFCKTSPCTPHSVAPVCCGGSLHTLHAQLQRYKHMMKHGYYTGILKYNKGNTSEPHYKGTAGDYFIFF